LKSMRKLRFARLRLRARKSVRVAVRVSLDMRRPREMSRAACVANLARRSLDAEAPFHAG